MLPTAPALRTAAIGCRIQPTLLSPFAYHTTAPAPLRCQEPSSCINPRGVPLAKRNVSFKSRSPTVRSLSSISTPSSTPSSSTSEPSRAEHLDWNTFFKLRKTRRRYQLATSVGTGVGGFALGVQLILRLDMDPFLGQIPLDPFITLGLISTAFGGIGWLTGPILGNAIFNLKNRKFREQMDLKEKEFYARVKKYRVDPSASSMANPVPDYYGEKIASVAGYRRWLKDQRAFNKKRQTYV